MAGSCSASSPRCPTSGEYHLHPDPRPTPTYSGSTCRSWGCSGPAGSIEIRIGAAAIHTDLGGQPISLYRDPRGGAVASGPEVPWGRRRWLLPLVGSAAGPEQAGGAAVTTGSTPSTATDLWRMSALELAKVVRSGEASSREVIEAHLHRIEEVNPSINAVTVVFGEQALEAAKTADDAVAAGVICPHSTGCPSPSRRTSTSWAPTTLGLKAMAEAYPSRDAPVVERARAAGRS